MGADDLIIGWDLLGGLMELQTKDLQLCSTLALAHKCRALEGFSPIPTGGGGFLYGRPHLA